MSQKKKVAIVLGASGGIGFSLVEKLIREGTYIVYAFVKNPRSCPELLILSKTSSNLRLVKFQIGKKSNSKLLINKIVKAEGRIDFLISCVAHILFGAFETTHIDQIRRQFDICFFGILEIIQNVLPVMRVQQQGSVLVMGSTSGIDPSPMYASYCCVKAAMESMLFSLACNVRRWGVNVVVVELSAVKTNIIKKSLEIGSKDINPEYKRYVNRSLKLLKSLISNGENVSRIAQFILSIMEGKEPPPFRVMATKKAEEIISKKLRDPQSLSLHEVVKAEELLFI